MKPKQHTFCHSTYRIKDGILFCTLSKDIVIDEDLAKTMVQKRKETFGAIEMPVCVDLDNLLSIDHFARNFFASPETWQHISACSFFTTNKLLEILWRAWYLLSPPPVPVKIFNTQASAIVWLEQYKCDQSNRP